MECLLLLHRTLAWRTITKAKIITKGQHIKERLSTNHKGGDNLRIHCADRSMSRGMR